MFTLGSCLPLWWREPAVAYGIDLDGCPSSTSREPLLVPSTGACNEREVARDPRADVDGVLGLGLAGVWFTRAKGARAGRVEWAHDTVLVDALAGIRVVDGKELSRDTDSLRAVLTEGVRQLVVVAHGDGGHLDLGDLVLCGLYADVEAHLETGNRLERGCAAGRRCKRANDISKVMLCRDVRAGVVIIVSCKAGSLVDAAFPTTSNVVLGFLDGFAATVVAAAGNAMTSRAITEGLHRVARRDAVPEIREYLDDVSGHGLAPYLVFGTMPGKGKVASGPDGPVEVHRIAHRRPGAVAVLDRPGVLLRPGVDSAFGGRHLVLPTGVPTDVVRIVDGWRPAGRAALDHRADLDRLRLLHRQLASGLPADRPDAIAIGQRLAEIRLDHEQSGFTAHRRLINGAEHGLVPAPGGSAATERALDRWAEAAAEAFTILLDGGDPMAILSAGMWAGRRRLGVERCDQCGEPLRTSELSDPRGGPGRVRYDCPQCGGRRLVPADTGVTGASCLVRHGARPELEIIPAAGARAQLAWRVAYKRSAFRIAARRQALDGPTTLRLPVPPDVTDQLHSLKVVLTAGSRVWAWRIRLAAR